MKNSSIVKIPMFGMKETTAYRQKCQRQTFDTNACERIFMNI